MLEAELKNEIQDFFETVEAIGGTPLNAAHPGPALLGMGAYGLQSVATIKALQTHLGECQECQNVTLSMVRLAQKLSPLYLEASEALPFRVTLAEVFTAPFN